jgi:phosphoribosylformimino-5-aminoimidazole carboxamide ribotide isomerase
MLVIPAIDLLAGRAVRLRQGRREEATVYSDRPWELAAAFLAAGARRLHVVDLDGAFAGQPANTTALERIIAAAPGLEVQLGGGVRDLPTVVRLRALGVARLVLGTAALRDPELLRAACRAEPGRIIVAVDAREGKVAVKGWTEVSAVSPATLGRAAREAGAAALLYTDVARDGMQEGPNVAATTALVTAVHPLPVIASGGVGRLDDLRALAQAGLPAAVVGRALYEGTFTLAEALAAGEG